MRLLLQTNTNLNELIRITSSSAKIVYVKGRQHPVKIYHTVTGQNDYVDSALRTFFQIHVDQPPGDVLIFLPGILFEL